MSRDLSMKISIFNFNKLILTLIILFFIHLSVLLNLNLAYSEENKELGQDPIHITSDSMVAEKGTSMVEFIGNVEATQLDSVLLADSMKVYFMTDKKKEKSGSKQYHKDRFHRKRPIYGRGTQGLCRRSRLYNR